LIALLAADDADEAVPVDVVPEVDEVLPEELGVVLAVIGLAANRPVVIGLTLMKILL
jgi:hypothetical protein